jgi:hypothetical protein
VSDRVPAWVALALLAGLLVGCETMESNAKLRGEHDLQCAVGHVVVTTGAQRGTFVATGCSRTATYKCVVTEETGIPVCEPVVATP